MSIIILSYGAQGFDSVGADAAHDHVTNPFALIISMGTLIMVVSLLGTAGACCATSYDDGTPGRWRKHSNRALLLYFGVILFTIAGLLYGTMLCFLWSDKAEDIIDTYWDSISLVVKDDGPNDVAQWLKDNAAAGGVACLVGIFLNILCAHCCAVLMGYKYTARKSVLLVNIFGFALGMTTTIIALVPGSQDVGVHNSWLPEFIGSLGIITMLFAMLGFYAAFRNKGGLLLFNAASLSVMAVLLLGFAIFCISDAEDASNLLREQWEVVKVRYVDVCPECELPPANASQTDHDEFRECCADKAALLVWHNLSVLGCSCTVTLLCVFGNAVGSWYLWRKLRQQLLDEMAQGEVDGLQDGVTRQSAMERADKYRAEELQDDL
eukprot:CAMPEP_0181299216 /NCGR_PEP_ID=MMETSP1101-20121128/6221_1 /TAXON_ID=46948 /ORGANISM="Rhodomonas abbreviata, Strain Caron Lab Isolate" /LENGTH=379 /DNA_ID=CAMNT_0023404337 /DNA_START=90 /DNA_END=1229 /DNA_ORIENTATION=+